MNSVQIAQIFFSIIKQLINESKTFRIHYISSDIANCLRGIPEGDTKVGGHFRNVLNIL